MAKEIPFDRFLQCHLNYYEKFKKAERTFTARKADFLRSTEGLICHPETSERYKSQLLKFRQALLTS